MRAKVIATVLASVLLIGVAIGWALTRRSPVVEVDPAASLRTPGLLVRDTTTGRLAVISPNGKRAETAVLCSRVYAAAGRGVCLHRDETSPNTFQLSVLDAGLNAVRSFGVNGVPTRARVSTDGRMISWTTFVSGDSYTATTFSTRSGILDLGTDVMADSLEDFTVRDPRGSGRKPPADANFWGVSFAADDNTFYATMATGPHFYLVRGDFAAESMTVVGDGVECPSLSPDDTRLVYKRRLPDHSWQLWVLDLATRHRTQLAERDTVDDQGAWLDDHTIAYAKAEPTTGAVSLWSVPADGSGSPSKIVDGAESPAVLRP